MALYAGETILISVSGRDFDQETPLSDDEISAMYMSVFDTAGTEVLPLTSMIYSESLGKWAYSWNTTNMAPGGYKIKVEAFGQAATPQSYSLEYKRIRLARPLTD